MKPHICRSPLGGWQCFGLGTIGAGGSPAIAYADWALIQERRVRERQRMRQR